MELPETEVALFDMDGVLTNLFNFWKIAEREVFSSLSVPVTPERSQWTEKMTTREAADFWYSLYPWQGISILQAETEVVRKVVEQVHVRGELLPIATEMLKGFHDRGSKIGLVSNTPKPVVDAVVDQFNLSRYLSYTVTPERLTHPKPDPEGYQKALCHFGASADSACAVEDSRTGRIAAMAAGISTIVTPTP